MFSVLEIRVYLYIFSKIYEDLHIYEDVSCISSWLVPDDVLIAWNRRIEFEEDFYSLIHLNFLFLN